MFVSSFGSSPRAWGKLGAAGKGYWKTRLIPTGVGKTVSTEDTNRFSTVHPHGRGENKTKRQAAAIALGSSPRAWGKRMLRAYPLGNLRFIPTGAGKVFPPSPSEAGLHDSGGDASRFIPTEAGKRTNEHQPRDSGRFIPTGVGKLTILYSKQLNVRFIPTGVGKTTVGPRQRGP